MVHLFFLEKPSSIDPVTKLDEEYRLLFTGEVIGFNWVQTPMTRCLVLNCIDFSSYWDAAVAATVSFGPGANVFSDIIRLSGGKTSLFTDIVGSTTPEVLQRLLNQPPQTPGLETVRGLAGGVIRVLEALSGVQGKHKGVNDFFTIAELRCRILEQICAEEEDNTAQKLVDLKVFDEFIRNGLQNLGNEVTFRQVLLTLFRYIYYDFVPNPAAKYELEVKRTGATSQKVTRSVSIHDKVRRLTDKLRGVATRLHERIRGKDAVQQVGSEVNKVISEVITGYRQAASSSSGSSLKTAISALEVVQSSISNAMEDRNGQALADRAAEIDLIVEIVDLSADVSVSEVENVDTSSTLSRLKSHILRPDCWFAPPPRCNVIFPEHYTTLNYDRTFIGEPTRMMTMFYDTLVGDNELLSARLMTPTEGSFTSVLTENLWDAYRKLMPHEYHTGIVARMDRVPNIAAPVSKETNADAAKKFSGAKMSWGGKIALFNFFRERFYQRTAAVSGRFNPYLVAGFPALVVLKPFTLEGDNSDLSQDISELVQDQAFAQAHGAPSQLLGMVTGLTHSISQEGGTTNISLNYVREHLFLDDEYLVRLGGAENSKLNEPFKKRVRYSLRWDDIDDPDLKKKMVEATPQRPIGEAGRIVVRRTETVAVNVPLREVNLETGETSLSFSSVDAHRTIETSEVSTGKPGFAKLKPLPGLGREGLQPDPAGKIGPGSKGIYGDIVAIEVRDPSVLLIPEDETFGGNVVFREMTFYEDIQVSPNTPIPFEEIVRADWFSKSYANVNIGEKIYQPFFGTGSIVDELAFASSSGGNIEQADTSGILIDTSDSVASVLQQLQDNFAAASKASVTRSVNLLSYIYGKVLEGGSDVEGFIHQYVLRPIAGFTDIFGFNLEFDQAGNPTKFDDTAPLKYGFHTGATHPMLVNNPAKLTGLLEDPSLSLPRISGLGKEAPVDPKYDVRKEKRDRAAAYRLAIEKGPAFRG